MFIKRKEYETLLSEKQTLENKVEGQKVEINNLNAVAKKRDNVIASKEDTITFLKSRVEALEASETELFDKLHKKDQPRTGGKFAKKIISTEV